MLAFLKLAQIFGTFRASEPSFFKTWTIEFVANLSVNLIESQRVQCSAVPCGEQLSALEQTLSDYDVIGIDEGQFVRDSSYLSYPLFIKRTCQRVAADLKIGFDGTNTFLTLLTLFEVL